MEEVALWGTLSNRRFPSSSEASDLVLVRPLHLFSTRGSYQPFLTAKALLLVQFPFVLRALYPTTPRIQTDSRQAPAKSNTAQSPKILTASLGDGSLTGRRISTSTATPALFQHFAYTVSSASRKGRQESERGVGLQFLKRSIPAPAVSPIYATSRDSHWSGSNREKWLASRTAYRKDLVTAVRCMLIRPPQLTHPLTYLRHCCPDELTMVEPSAGSSTRAACNFSIGSDFRNCTGKSLLTNNCY